LSEDFTVIAIIAIIRVVTVRDREQPNYELRMGLKKMQRHTTKEEPRQA
jgi:hypothetical protein